MSVEVGNIGAIKVLRFPKMICNSTATDFVKCIDEFISVGHVKFICDLSQTEFIADPGLEIFLTTLSKLHRLNGQMAFCMLNPAIRELFVNAGLTHIYKYYDVDESLQMHVLKELACFFNDYDDIHDIRIQRSEEQLHIEIIIEYDPECRMKEVQASINKIKSCLEDELKGSEVKIIPFTVSIAELPI